MGRTDDTYLKQLQARYRKGSKKEKTVILDEYAKTCAGSRSACPAGNSLFVQACTERSECVPMAPV